MKRSVKAKLKPPPPPPQQERTYTTREVMSICDVTPRQLQWWDEHGLVCPDIKSWPRGRARHYAPGQVTAVSIAAELRRKGIGLGAIRRILSRIPADIPEYLLIADGKVHAESDELAVIEKAKKVEGGVMLLEIESKDGIRIAHKAGSRSDSRSPVTGLAKANGVTGTQRNRSTAMGGGAR